MRQYDVKIEITCPECLGWSKNDISNFCDMCKNDGHVEPVFNIKDFILAHFYAPEMNINKEICSKEDLIIYINNIIYNKNGFIGNETLYDILLEHHTKGDVYKTNSIRRRGRRNRKRLEVAKQYLTKTFRKIKLKEFLSEQV